MKQGKETYADLQPGEFQLWIQYGPRSPIAPALNRNGMAILAGRFKPPDCHMITAEVILQFQFTLNKEEWNFRFKHIFGKYSEHENCNAQGASF